MKRIKKPGVLLFEKLIVTEFKIKREGDICKKFMDLEEISLFFF